MSTRDKSKSYILLCTLHCPNTTSFHYLRNFRKILGRDNVISCGPERSSISWDFKKGTKTEFGHDVEMKQIDHPHMYSYSQIFDRCKEEGFDTDFDLILIMEPNFCPSIQLDGEKIFRPKCHISYYQCDTHRGPRTAMKNMVLGSVDSFISPNIHFLPLFREAHTIDGVRYLPEKKLILSPTAFDPDIHKRYVEEQSYEEHDIIFLGNDGIDKWRGPAHGNFELSQKWAIYQWKNDKGNVLRQEGPHPLFQIGCATDHRFGEYGARSEILCRLRRDFPGKFKILGGSIHPIEYSKILNRGRMVINCSINYDLNMRVAEAMGSGRLLITDYMPGIETVAGKEDVNYISYKKYFHHLNVNFDLEYDILQAKILKLLINREKVAEMQEAAYSWMRSSGQTYKDRCIHILKETIGWEIGK